MEIVSINPYQVILVSGQLSDGSDRQEQLVIMYKVTVRQHSDAYVKTFTDEPTIQDIQTAFENDEFVLIPKSKTDQLEDESALLALELIDTQIKLEQVEAEQAGLLLELVGKGVL